jgi:hypothetical protein
MGISGSILSPFLSPSNGITKKDNMNGIFSWESDMKN